MTLGKKCSFYYNPKGKKAKKWRPPFFPPKNTVNLLRMNDKKSGLFFVLFFFCFMVYDKKNDFFLCFLSEEKERREKALEESSHGMLFE